MIKTFERTYTNSTSNYQLIGSYKDVIFAGSEAECYAELDKLDIENSKWGSAEVVAPGKTIKGTLCNVVADKIDVDLDAHKDISWLFRG